jgi:hypothetical protein
LQTYVRGTGGANSVLSTKAWRKDDGVNFDIKAEQAYTYRAGYRLYPAASTSTAPGSAIKVGNSANLSFTFDGATSSLIGLSSIACATLATMF